MNKLRPEENIGLYFHKLSKDKTMGGKSPKIFANKTNWPSNWLKVEYKKYKSQKTYKLKKISLINERYLSESMFRRKSQRHFKQRNHSIGIDELSYILSNSAGIKHGEKNKLLAKRTYPSGGARYSLEIYILVQNSHNLEHGLYHYDLILNSIVKIKENAEINASKEKLFTYDWAYSSSCAIFITSIFDRSMRKYSERGYRYVLIEAGHLGQNICLTSSNLSLNVCPLGGTNDYLIEKKLGVDGVNESLVYTIVIG